ncbi:MAG: hypothetical protein IJM02_01520 [Clostridia bacterium]|nr:hypothetical protein [Clostridia bacterium]
MKKVLIEFFDEENLNNCISQMYFEYRKAYYLRFESQKKIDGIGPVFKKLDEFNRERFGAECKFKDLKSDDPEEIIRAIEEIVSKEEGGFDFDITGGPESFAYAVRGFVERNNPKNVCVHYYDFAKKKYFRTYPKFETRETPFKRKLTVPSLIMLQASSVSNDEIPGGRQYRPGLNKNDYKENIKTVWNCVKKKAGEWNSFCSLANINKDEKTGKFLTPDCLIIKNFGSGQKAKIEPVLSSLEEAGVIEIKELTSRQIKYYITLPKEQWDLLDKGGNALELYTYYVASTCGKYNDCCVGVHLDWDGDVKNDNEEVTNEADVILSDGYLPVFISCKNTEVEKACIYEILFVARYYGGKYAKPVIFSSVKASKAIRNRTKESEIILIDDIANLTEDQFREKIINLT